MASVETEVLLLPHAAATAIFAKTPDRFGFVLAPMMAVLRFAYFFLAETNGRPPNQVVAQRLLDLTRCLYDPETPLAARIDHVSQEDLAAATYLTRPTVNRILRDLESKGVVELGYGQIAITNVDGLFGLASANAREAFGLKLAHAAPPVPSTVEWPDTGLAQQRRAKLHTSLMAGAWFQALTASMRSAVLDNLIWRNFKDGEVAARTGEEGDGILGIVSGQFRTLGVASEGSQKLLGLLRPGDWTAFATVLDGKPQPGTIVASGDSSAVLLPKAACDQIFKTDVPRYKAIIAPMMALLRFLYDYLIETNGRPPARVVAQRLHDLAGSTYLPEQKTRSFVSNLSQEDLASATGLSRPTVNRVLRDLAAQGIIGVGYGNITIHDPEALLSFGKTVPK